VELKFRHDIIKLVKPNGIGIELGVARGEFAERILKANHLSMFYGVDKYDDHHNEVEYQTTLKKLSIYKNYTLHRMTFEQALDLFPDEHFDFIYIDGYAHTGQDNGKTLHDWYKKCKTGGIFSGDDYTPEYQLTIDNVDQFVKQHGKKLNVINCSENTTWSRNPTWYIQK
jgi:ubiquinone/menaquinone biosynthesis C-methylase UbiE